MEKVNKNFIYLFLISLKTTKVYKNFLRFLLVPLYDIIWKNIINIQGRLLYIIWLIVRKEKDAYEINKNEKTIIYKNQEFLDLVNKINNNLTKEILDESIKKILQGDTGSERKTDSPFRNKEENYSRLILKELPKSIVEEIIQFGCSSKMINTASKYLGVYPILARVNLSLNIPREGKKERTSMLWHKDDFGYKSFDLVTWVSDVDENNGPFYTIKKNNSLGPFYKIKNIIKNPLKGERGKVHLEDFSKLYGEEDILEFRGEKGTSIFIDSFGNYHRGGFCIKNTRVKLRYEYTTIDSLTINEKKPAQEFYDFYNGLQKKSFFIRYLLFKRSNFFEKLKISKILIKFYNLFSYKHL